MVKSRVQVVKIFCLIFVISLLLYPAATFSVSIKSTFPRRANFFLKYSLTESEARELAKWDLVILDMETQVNSRALLQKMRQWNPGITMLAYITSEEIVQNPLNSSSALRRQLGSQIPDAWYVTDSHGSRLRFWPGTDLLNVSDLCPIVNGKRFNQYLSEFIRDQILSTGLWDGVFYDNSFDSITFFTGQDVDLNRDRIADTDIDVHWQNGMKALYNETRRLTAGNALVVGNGTTRAYRNELNGNMIENFIAGSPWSPTMRTYAFNGTRTYSPVVNIINANTGNTGVQNNYRQMRFGLASTLMEDGYYSFDYGDQNHGQTWWYDEYGIELGKPVGSSNAQNGARNYEPDVWQRQFDNGIAVVNSTNATKQVSLPGDFEHIHGTQDPVVNNGAIVDTVTVAPNDGVLLLKTISTLDDIFYPNGSFVRFFHSNGTRAKNGFFLFDDGYSGGDQIAHIDLTKNGMRDLVVVARNAVTATRDDGQPLFRVFPYTANFSGKLFVSLGAPTESGRSTIIVSGSSVKNSTPIITYDVDGNTVGSPWRPTQVLFQKGPSVAVAKDATRSYVVVAAGAGQAPLISLYTPERKLIRQWYGFEKTFRGGLKVTTGDLTGDGVDEIIVAPASGKAAIIKMFDFQGREIFGSFTASKSTTGVVGLATADVDFDNRKEIVVMSNSPGL